MEEGLLHIVRIAMHKHVGNGFAHHLNNGDAQ